MNSLFGFPHPAPEQTPPNWVSKVAKITFLTPSCPLHTLTIRLFLAFSGKILGATGPATFVSDGGRRKRESSETLELSRNGKVRHLPVVLHQ